MIHLIRQDIAGLRPYEAHVIEGNVKMDANENPFPWPEGMKEKIYAMPFEFNRYPDGKAIKLREAIAVYNGVKMEEVLTGNGSDELITVILNTFGGRGRTLIIHPPTFSMYAAAAAITGTALTEISLIGGIRLDLEKMLQASRLEEVGVIIICNPNNPTGTLFPKEEILEIAKNTKALVVVDEAYIEFAGESLIDQIHNYPNLVIMKTFSKAFGMAALRLGYVVAKQELIQYLNKVRQPFNVNSFSQQAGIVALQYAVAYQEQVKLIKKEIQILDNELRKIPGLKVLPTRANFILFQPPDPDRWAAELAGKGFSIRNLGNLPEIGKSLRISSGVPGQNRAFLQALKEVAELIGRS